MRQRSRFILGPRKKTHFFQIAQWLNWSGFKGNLILFANFSSRISTFFFPSTIASYRESCVISNDDEIEIWIFALQQVCGTRGLVCCETKKKHSIDLAFRRYLAILIFFYTRLIDWDATFEFNLCVKFCNSYRIFFFQVEFFVQENMNIQYTHKLVELI